VIPSFPPCERADARSVVVLQEGRAAFRAENPQGREVRRVRVDGCVITGDGPRCDWLLVFVDGEGHEHAWFVELKGSDAHRGIAQVVATATHVRGLVGGGPPPPRWLGFVAVARGGAVPSTTVQNELARAKRTLPVVFAREWAVP
jgi:hypothetical protein